jgi:cobalt/nickel transport system permease protein
VHIPDGFIDAQVSVAAAVVSAAVVTVCLRGARRTMEESAAPMAGLVAVFVFAAQMFNFPIGVGTSGHLIGAALAVILVGPYAGVLAVTVVLVVQALFFADGGLTALGLNVLNLAILTTLIAWPTFKLLVRWLGSGKPVILAAAGLAGFLSVIAAASGFVIEFALGGTTAVSFSTIATAMLSVHTLIAVIEGVITAMVVASIATVRPDLVAGLASVRRRDRNRIAAQAQTVVS